MSSQQPMWSAKWSENRYRRESGAAKPTAETPPIMKSTGEKTRISNENDADDSNDDDNDERLHTAELCGGLPLLGFSHFLGEELSGGGGGEGDELVRKKRRARL